MRLSIVLGSVSLICIGCSVATAQLEPATNPTAAPAAQTAGPSADAPVDAVLDKLDAVGENLKAFDANVRLTMADAVSGDAYTRSGKVAFQNLDAGNARMRITFDRKEVGDHVLNETVEYLLEDGWLVERDYRKKIEVRRQALRPGEKINLLKLGEGPFPLPIGQDKEEVHKLFEVQPIDAAQNDPPGTSHLQLTPRPETQFDRKFTTIDIWVDPTTGFPRRIETLDKNQTEVTTTDLDNLRLNPDLADAAFELPPTGDDWTRHDEPFRD